MKKSLTIVEIGKRVQIEADCHNYFNELKWGDSFTCVICQCNEFHKEQKWYYRGCKGCGNDESAAANTLFNRCKLELLVAFEMAFRMSAKEKGMSTIQLSRKFGCQQKSA